MKKLLLLLTLVISSSILNAQEQENEWGFINSIPDYQTGSHLGAVCAVTEDLVYLTAKHGMFYKSTDGGETWTVYDSGTDMDFVDLAFYDAHIGFAVGTNGTILKTSDSGANWNLVNSGTTHNLASISLNGLHDIWVVGGAGRILHSTDIGETWQIDTSQTSEQLNSIAFNNTGTGYIAGNNGVLLKTTDGGQTWNPVELDFENNDSNDLFSLNIDGNSVRMLQGQVEVQEGQYFGISFHGSSILSTNDGSNWNSTSTPSSNYLGSSKIVFKNLNEGYSISSAAALCDCCSAEIHKTADGQNWTQSFFAESSADPCLSNWGFADISLVGDTGYAFQGNHVLKLNGGDDYWLKVKQLTKTNIQLYPNPATDQITLDFKDTNPANFSARIFDLQGKQILSKQNLKKGNTIRLEDFTSGVYFLKLMRNGKPTSTKKFIKQ